MRWAIKLCRNGNSTTLTIPRPMLNTLGWIPSDLIIATLEKNGTVSLELFESGSGTRPRRTAMLAPVVTTVQP